MSKIADFCLSFAAAAACVSGVGLLLYMICDVFRYFGR